MSGFFGSPASGGGLTIGSTAITGGTTTRLLYDLAGVVQEAAGVTVNATSSGLTLTAAATGAASLLTLTGQTGILAASQPVIDATQTWNASGVTFTGLKLNVTNTASAAGSLLMDLQVGGTSAFSFSKPGTQSGGLTMVSGVDTLTMRADNQYYCSFTSANDFRFLFSAWCAFKGAGTAAGSAAVDQNGLNISASAILFARHAVGAAAGGTATISTDIHQADEVCSTLAIIGQAPLPAAVTNLIGGNVTVTGGAGASGSAGAANGGNVKIGGGLGYGTGTNGSVIIQSPANGKAINIQELTELTTIAAAATTDTTIQIPANALVIAVSVRNTVAIPTAATYTVIGTSSSTVFNTAAVAVAVNTTDAGTKAGVYYNATAQTIRITPNLTPGTNVGRVRVTIHYITITPPTS